MGILVRGVGLVLSRGRERSEVIELLWTCLYRWFSLRGMQKVVAVHLPVEMVEQVDAAAADDDRTRVGMVRRLVAEGLQRRAETVEDGSRVRNIHYQRGELTR